MLNLGNGAECGRHTRRKGVASRGAGRTIIGNDGGGELSIHGRDGAVRAKDHCPGTDPGDIPG